MTKSIPCALCKIYKDRNSTLFASTHFFCRFDDNPITPGHLIIVPKKHIVSLFDLSEAQWKDLRVILKKSSSLIKATNLKKFYSTLLMMRPDSVSTKYWRLMLKHKGISRRPDGYNIGINEGEAAGRTIHHVHIHLIPRYKGDVKNPRGGIRNIIPKLGNYR